MPKQIKWTGNKKAIDLLHTLMEGANPETDIAAARKAWCNIEWNTVSVDIDDRVDTALLPVKWEWLKAVLIEEYVNEDTRTYEGDLWQGDDKVWRLNVHVPSCGHEHDCCGCVCGASMKFANFGDDTTGIVAVTSYNY